MYNGSLELDYEDTRVTTLTSTQTFKANVANCLAIAASSGALRALNAAPCLVNDAVASPQYSEMDLVDDFKPIVSRYPADQTEIASSASSAGLQDWFWLGPREDHHTPTPETRWQRRVPPGGRLAPRSASDDADVHTRTRSRASSAPPCGARPPDDAAPYLAPTAEAFASFPPTGCNVSPEHWDMELRAAEQARWGREAAVVDTSVLTNAVVALAAPSCSTLTSVASPCSECDLAPATCADQSLV